MEPLAILRWKAVPRDLRAQKEALSQGRGRIRNQRLGQDLCLEYKGKGVEQQQYRLGLGQVLMRSHDLRRRRNFAKTAMCIPATRILTIIARSKDRTLRKPENLQCAHH